MEGDDDLDTCPAHRYTWDVFLSFRGEDTRRDGFVISLYNDLDLHGVRVFLDDKGMERGDEIDAALRDAIEDSAAAIAVISKNYANSKWCLEELARIMDWKRLMIPVFYDVDPSHVRWQTGSFEADFNSHSKQVAPEKVKRWRDAMNLAGRTSGFDSRTFRESSVLIKILVNKILKTLNNTPLRVAKYQVGLDSRVDKLLNSKLDVIVNGVCVIGLYGMGGIGKTTLAKALYNKLIIHYKKRCFLSSVREESQKPNGLEYLQGKLIASLTSKDHPPAIPDTKKGISYIKEITHKDPILVVLDDVDHSSQLDALAGSRDWFHNGSRIIITSRDKSVLQKNVVDGLIHEVEVLTFPESLQLFSYHALGKHHPTKKFEEISEKIVELTGCLPLALEVFGSCLFFKRGIKVWEDEYEKLKRVHNHDLLNILEISFKSLDEQQRCVFLDLACFFVGKKMKREDAIDIFKGCGFSAESVITDLTARSLVKITDENVLWMHDQLRDMGRQVVRRESKTDAGKRSRLWDQDEILKVFKYEKGSSSIEGITFDFANSKQEKDDERVVFVKAFKPMLRLRLLEINNAKLDHGYFKSTPIPHELKWLQWRGCPLESLPMEFFTEELAVLDLSHSNITRLWPGTRLLDFYRNKVGKKLIVVNLSACRNLRETPDLSGLCSLQKLILENCSALRFIHNSIGDMSKLTYLNLGECENLEKFPSDVSGLKCLDTLILSGCKRLRDLPDDLSGFVSLRELLLDRTAIVKLPLSIFRLKHLEVLNLNDCASLTLLPASVGNLSSLRELSLNGCALQEMPGSIGQLKNLEILKLGQCDSLTSLPESIGDLESLTELYLDNSVVNSLPTSIGSLRRLNSLSLNHCRKLSRLPDSICGLSSLVSLRLNGAAIVEVPSQIGSLSALEKLDLGYCQMLKSLPDSIKDLSSLRQLILNDLLINALPDSLCDHLERLDTLRLSNCKKLQRLPSSFGKLKNLRYLYMDGTAVVELPIDIGSLSCLRTLRIRKEDDLGQFAEFVLPASFSNLSKLEELDAHAFGISGEISDDFGKLILLESLDLSRNHINSLPSNLKSLSRLKNLSLAHCKELKLLPSLPCNLFKLSVANCTALESIHDMSYLLNLQELDLTNCNKVIDIPGLENLESLRFLYAVGCNACLPAIKTILTKVALRRMRYLCVPGSEIPTSFVSEVPNFACRKNQELKGVIIGIVISLNQQAHDSFRSKLPAIVDIQAKIIRKNDAILTTTLRLVGVPNTDEDQLYLCRFHDYNNIVLMLEEGDTLRVTMRPNPLFQGLTLKKHGIQLVFENDDDYEECDEALFADESKQSVSKRLLKFVNSL